ncbi:CDP-diacylglycerol--glycerol-3-phosphate 3-phosphatidyltransferase [Metamycoplasma hominis]|uniref:CDP-diacylglycerol--glycerol-3-phosphate 3-phosphatidyltransferase n=1 Tax=Metamycoplasma hominis TaxID=2098 RepID=UPI000DE03CF6|nr:CDP-diacylglycerol--glycerol-3-phosphate 3-phosphatidyltransferase [Metamycoplasma hominis]RBI34136.1 CDP-diacylglycerol--glycerol-3-phosphate 3-phosphatidyltransferase [Metamycoplasma hominis]
MKNKSQKKQKIIVSKFGVANWLTVLRMLLMIPFIVFLSTSFGLILNGVQLSYKTNKGIVLSILYWINVAIFIIAMITDFLDGFYARKTKTVSSFGKIFDPIADKVATTLMLLFLATYNFVYIPIVILFIIRDIIVDGTRVYAVKKNIEVSANWFGKIKTILVSLALVVISIGVPFISDKSDYKYILFYFNIPLIIGLLLAWISGIIYIIKYTKGINKELLQSYTKNDSDATNKNNQDQNNNNNNKSNQDSSPSPNC